MAEMGKTTRERGRDWIGLAWPVVLVPVKCSSSALQCWCSGLLGPRQAAWALWPEDWLLLHMLTHSHTLALDPIELSLIVGWLPKGEHRWLSCTR
ncbi:hypothetical protein TYRP_015575 [Tyrophagus putrescentiae]|nr:hypothetical protein TYRP_015575 [Tyrophagus putrescentiae]